MQRFSRLVLIASVCLVAGIVAPCCSEPVPVGQDGGSRPVRPKVFTSPEELRKYLDDLSDYYAYVGRPRICTAAPGAPGDLQHSILLVSRHMDYNNQLCYRFGKRLSAPAIFRGGSGSGNSGVAAAETGNSLRYPAPAGAASDLYEMLFQYDE